MWYQLRGFVFLFVLGVTLAEDETSDVFLKTTYCACKCCAGDPSSCVRHPLIKPTYKCSESMCNEKMCTIWEKSKCKTYCFCDKCKSVIDKNDVRCSAYKGNKENCKCKEKIDCEKKKKEPEALKNAFADVNDKSKTECTIPCYCKKCKAILPPENYEMCLSTSPPEKHCDCERVKCPEPDVLENLKKLREIRKKREEEEKKGASYQFSDDMDQVMDAKKSKQMKCRMQCYCSVCGEINDNIDDTCEKMLPKPRVEDCPECDRDSIDCHTQDIDQQCKVYCFCKGCKGDPRMPLYMVENCLKMTKEDKGCLCADEEDCGMIDKVQKRGAEVHQKNLAKKKEQRKKGKLKKKKPQRDEL